METIVIGIDPGEVTGIGYLRLTTAKAPDFGKRIGAIHFAQVTAGLVTPILHGIRHRVEMEARIVVAIERFVVGSRAGRTPSHASGAVTRELVTLATAWAELNNAEVVLRSAADVKPWATDERLDKAGLLNKAQGMRHAKDGGRHALFEAVKNHGLPDPLSRRGGAA